MVRLDKYLCDQKIGTRSQVKELVRKGLVTVNGTVCKSSDVKISEQDNISYNGQILNNQKLHYIMLNKPAGVITATVDDSDKTVLDIVKEYPCRNLFPVGRLDKDTTGLLIITNDGNLSHDLLSPKKHVDKEYEVILKRPITASEIKQLESGVFIGDDLPTLPAKVIRISDNRICLTIHEGRYHQVKRMAKAVGNEVIGLNRIRMGGLELDKNLGLGEYRCLTEVELGLLCSKE